MVGNLKHKINELDQLLCDAIENYHTPERFFTYSHSLIQACRNLTFAVQSNKKQIPGFEAWYTPWQEAMKTDPYMKWLNAKRTKLVHEDVIASESYAAITTLPDYANAWFEEHYDYRASTEDVIAQTKKLISKRPELSYAVMQIERMYKVKVDEKPDELVHVLSHVFCFLCMLISDLEIYLKGEAGYEGPPLNLGEDIEEMTAINDSFRFSRFKFRTGEQTGGSLVRIKRDEAMVQLAIERYGNQNMKNIPKMKPADAAKALYKAAKIMLQKDGSYLSMVFIYTPKGYYPIAVTFRDRAEKILFSHQMATRVKNLNGTAVIFISETWAIDDLKKWNKRISAGKEIAGMRNKEEALSLMMLMEDGTTLGITTKFTHEGDQIVFDDDYIDHPPPETMGMLLPIYAMWNAKNKKDSDDKKN